MDRFDEEDGEEDKIVLNTKKIILITSIIKILNLDNRKVNYYKTSRLGIRLQFFFLY